VSPPDERAATEGGPDAPDGPDVDGTRDAGDGPDRPWWLDRAPGGPVPVEGGIQARAKRGPIGRRWWSARFLEVLESLGVGGRLGRGRSYARAGQVMELDTAAGSVRATVQGSRPVPYHARIGVSTYGKPEWARVEQAMADSAWYAAMLLSGEMPKDIEDVFTSVGLTLFPSDARDLVMDCDCPDHVVPCKHLAAVCYLLAESFDDDPFAILALRGRDRGTLLANIRARRAVPDPPPERDRPAEREEPVGPAVPELAGQLDGFYALPAPLPVPPPLPADPASVPDQLPPVALTIRGHRLVELLRPAYQALTDPD
jgi:uncharacterized Zn finger protein